MGQVFSTEQVDFLREKASGRSIDALRLLFNKRFGLDYGYNRIRTACKSRGICCGVVTRFKPGHVPHNKGKKFAFGGQETQFKKGQRPVNYRPVGSERVSVDGYTEVKIADPKTWKMKHVVEWEKENGPVPKGHVVIFADGNKTNFALDNLLLITRRVLAVINKRGGIQADPELTRLAVAQAMVDIKINDRLLADPAQGTKAYNLRSRLRSERNRARKKQLPEI